MSITVPRFNFQRRRIGQLATRWRPNPVRLWQLLWGPFWFGTEIPAPQHPGRGAQRTHGLGEIGQRLLTGIDQVCQQLRAQWLMTIIARTAWLSLLTTAIVITLQHTTLVQRGPLAPLAGVLAVAAAGFFFAYLAQPHHPQVARMLDRTFGLQERMTTALECTATTQRDAPGTSGVASMLVGEAAVLASHVSRSPLLQPRLPWRELGLLLASALLVLALVLFAPVDRTPVDEPVPWLPEASQTNPANDPAQSQATMALEGMDAQARRSAEAQRALGELAQALRDHGLTRETAEAIQRGDYSAAAESLRQLGDQVGEIAPSAREDLARDLDRASRSLPQPLSEGAAQGASGLRGNDAAGAAGLRELADAIESTGSDVMSQERQSGQGGQPGQQPNQDTASREQSQPGGGTDPSQAPGQGNPADPGAESSETAGQPGSDSGQDAQDGGSSSNAQGGGAGQESLVPAEQRTVDAPEATPRDAEDVSLPTGTGSGRPGDIALDSDNPGSGSGSAYTSGGEVTQQPVGAAGPDSNRVPAELRSIVERYFTPDAQ